VAVKIRLRRIGAKKQPAYRIVIADARSPRDGRFIEIIGHYNPLTEPSDVVINNERALYWLRNGAQPTEVVQRMLVKTGVWSEFTGEPMPTPPPKEEPKAEEPPAPAEEAPAEEAAAEVPAEEAPAEEAAAGVPAEEAPAEEAAAEVPAEEAPAEEAAAEAPAEEAPAEEAVEEAPEVEETVVEAPAAEPAVEEEHPVAEFGASAEETAETEEQA